MFLYEMTHGEQVWMLALGVGLRKVMYIIIKFTEGSKLI